MPGTVIHDYDSASIVLYLGSQPHHPPRDPEGVIAQAVRMEFGDDVPRSVGDWLAGRANAPGE